MKSEGEQPEIRFPVKGWMAIAVLLVLSFLSAACLVNLRDRPVSDEAMIRELRHYITTRYLSRRTEEVKRHLAAGNAEKARDAGTAIAALEVEIRAAQVAYPVITVFYDNKDVVAKVSYAVRDDDGLIAEDVGYFDVEYSRITDSWYCRGAVSRWYYWFNLDDDE